MEPRKVIEQLVTEVEPRARVAATLERCAADVVAPLPDGRG